MLKQHDKPAKGKAEKPAKPPKTSPQGEKSMPESWLRAHRVFGTPLPERPPRD